MIVLLRFTEQVRLFQIRHCGLEACQKLCDRGPHLLPHHTSHKVRDAHVGGASALSPNLFQEF